MFVNLTKGNKTTSFTSKPKFTLQTGHTSKLCLIQTAELKPPDLEYNRLVSL